MGRDRGEGGEIEERGGGRDRGKERRSGGGREQMKGELGGDPRIEGCTIFASH